MKKNMPLIFSILILILSNCTIISIGQDEFESSYIYVDDDNINGPWDGTFENPYQFIQDGINVAGDFDTVFVFNGNYIENIIVDKQIILEGENRDNTVIDGNHIEKDVINIQSENVIIRNFYITNCTLITNLVKYQGIFINASNVTIENNYIVKNEWTGLKINNDKNNCIIRNNVFYDNEFYNIFIYGNNNSIIFNDMDGMVVIHGGKNNNISNNYFHDSPYLGVWVSTNNNIISNNYIVNISNAIRIDDIYNVITRNYLEDNKNGIVLEGGYNMILNNHIENCRTAIKKPGYNNFIEKNNFINNSIYVNLAFYSNKYDNNYWDRPRLIKTIWTINIFYIIKPNPREPGDIGFFILYLCPIFDFHPAKGPFDIPIPVVSI